MQWKIWIGYMKSQGACVRSIYAPIVMWLSGWFINICITNMGFTWKQINLVILLFVLGGQGDKTTKPWMFTFWTSHKQTLHEKKAIDQTKKKFETKWNQLEIECNTSRKFNDLILVNLASNKLLHIIGIPMWGWGLSRPHKFWDLLKIATDISKSSPSRSQN